MRRRDFLFAGVAMAAGRTTPHMELAVGDDVELGGLLGQAADASCRGRLYSFVRDETSKPVAMFGREAAAGNTRGDWYGEHAGKWLYTAARAANRTRDKALLANVQRVAGYLARTQGPDGYLGTYAPSARMTAPGAEGKPGWDVWVHSYLILGFLELHRYWPDQRYLDAARRAGDLCVKLFTGGKSVARMGNHAGLSGTVLLEPMAELYLVTNEARYLDLARLILKQAEERPELQILSRLLRGEDVERIGDGKAYQLCWNFTGLARLYEATGEADYLRACRNAWTSIRDHHLTPAGGPWGGVGRFSELFNPQGFFSPYGFVETCSTMSWMQLNRDLLRLTGEAKYAEEFEKTAYNALLGAQDPDGHDWCYFTFPNGRRRNTYEWACCKSSGAMALEEIAPVVAGAGQDGVAVNLYTPAKVTVGDARLSIETEYPFSPHIRVALDAAWPGALLLRIPSWAENASATVNGAPAPGRPVAGEYLRLNGPWKPGDHVLLDLPMKPRVVRQFQATVQEREEVERRDYLSVARGPLVYAAGLIDGFKREETLRFHGVVGEDRLLYLNAAGRPPIPLRPYFEADGRKDGGWRLTWFDVAEG